MTTRIPKLHPSRYNHGYQHGIVMSVEHRSEILLSPDDVVLALAAFASDDMAKVLNTLGERWKCSMDVCMATDGLDEHGRRLVEDLHYFLQAEDGEE